MRTICLLCYSYTGPQKWEYETWFSLAWIPRVLWGHGFMSISWISLFAYFPKMFIKFIKKSTGKTLCNIVRSFFRNFALYFCLGREKQKVNIWVGEETWSFVQVVWLFCEKRKCNKWRDLLLFESLVWFSRSKSEEKEGN